MAGHLAELGLDREGVDALDQLLARLAIGDQVGDGDLLQLVLLGEGGDLRPLHHRAVVVGEFADHADRRQIGELAEIDRGLSMAGAHQHPALLGDQREDMAGADEIGGAHIAICQRAHGVVALLGRDAGGQPVLDVDRDGEGGAERGIVGGHHRIEPQAAGFLAGQGRADDAAGVADDEGHLLRRAERGGDDQIALVLAIIVIGDDDDLAAREGFNGLGDIALGHGGLAGALQAQEIIGGDGSARGGGDALGALARNPGIRIVAERSDARGRQARLAREGAAADLLQLEPGVEFHGVNLVRQPFACNEAPHKFQ